MKSARFAVAVFGLGLAISLGLFAHVLDQARASARVVAGLGDAAEPDREEARPVPVAGAEEEDLDETESARRHPLAAHPSPPGGLVVHVVDEAGRPIALGVLAYRGQQLVRAGETGIRSGLAHMIPFDGPGVLSVEYNGHELARLPIAEGRGRQEIVVPDSPSVAGVVRVAGVPRPDVGLLLVEGKQDWLSRWIEYGLEQGGLCDRPFGRIERTDAEGRFRFDWLTPEWSGEIRLAYPDAYRFTSGARRVLLARPDEELELEVEPLPALVVRGRVVLEGQPVPGAELEHRMTVPVRPKTVSSSASRPKSDSGIELALSWMTRGDDGTCDENGCFEIRAPESGIDELALEFDAPGIGSRKLALHGAEIRADLGDIELLPTRDLSFVVRSDSSSPIAGARARAPAAPEKHVWPGPFRSLMACSKQTDSSGRGVLHLELDQDTVRVSARGYVIADVGVLPPGSGALDVVLSRCASFQVVVRDRSGRIPRGLRVRLEASGAPFTWANGHSPEGDEETPENFATGCWLEGGPYAADFPLDVLGQTWIDSLRAGEPFDLSALDEYGSVVAAARGLVLEPGEWRRVELRVELEPRTLLAIVRDTFGRPLAGAVVDVKPRGGSDRNTHAMPLRTDRAGMARTEPLYSEDVSVVVRREGFEPRTLEHVAVPREGATLEVRLAHDWRHW